ncbi:MAG: hypothetical protein AAB225_13365 [Acidobacteriota bacterium]
MWNLYSPFPYAVDEDLSGCLTLGIEMDFADFARRFPFKKAPRSMPDLKRFGAGAGR